MANLNFPHDVINKVGNWQKNQCRYELSSNFEYILYLANEMVRLP